MASYYGQALMNIGSIIGSNMTRSIQEDERQADRLELQREREREATERQRERLAAQERQDALYRRTADQQTAARSGGGGGRAREYTPEEQTLLAVESGQFASQADVDRFKAAVKSGDFSGYQVDVTRGKVTDNGDPYNPEVTLSTAKEYPPGFDRERQAKARVLANIARESVQGKDLKDVNEGRQKEFELGVGQGVLSGEISTGRGSGAVGAMSGKPVFDIKDNTALGVYSGAMQTTEVGRSMVRENDAQAGEARARGKAASEGTGRPDIQGVAANAANLIKLAEAADADGDRVGAKALRAEAARLSTEAGAKKVPKPAEVKLSEADAHAQAQRALATGKISLDDVNKRLTGAGYKPLPADAGKAGAPKPSPAPAPKPETAPAPRDAGLSGMSTRDLRRIAGTQGHSRQAAAQAELARREAEAQTWEEEARTNRGMMP